MSAFDKVVIRKLPTGVPGLDEVLGGGLPEFSFNIIAGSPGCGKTTLAHQFMFANATPEKPAIYFTVLGEPAIKMLRYQQQYSFFDQSRLNSAIRFVNLSELVLEKDLDAVLARMIQEVEAVGPGIVIVDSFRTVARKSRADGGEVELQSFIQRLALHLTSWQATTFLIGEYTEGELRDNPVFTVADGLLWLHQAVDRNSIVRKLQVVKLRGQGSVPGLHTFRISSDGLQVFPRTFGLDRKYSEPKGTHLLSIGIPELDAMLGGGIPSGHSLLVAGPSGAGKSILGRQFIAEGLRRGEPGVVAMFEELPDEYVAAAKRMGMDFETPRKDGSLEILYLRPLDLSGDETVHEVVAAVNRTKAKRLVIDSLVGFEMALAPDYRTDFRESLYRMISALTRLGVTIVSTVEVEESFVSMGLSNFTISFLTDCIIRMRYVSIDGQLRRMMMVVKVRGGRHSIDLREFEITPSGFVIGERLRGYRALTSGIPEPLDQGLASIARALSERRGGP